MPQAGKRVIVRRRAARDRSPAVELTVRPVVPAFELRSGQARRFEDRVPGIVEIPVVDRDAPLLRHSLVESGARIGCEDVERRCLDAVLDCPLHGSREHRSVVGVHPEDEAAVDHHAEIVQAADGRGIVPPQVLILPLFREIRRVQRFEADEEAAQPRGDRTFQQIGSQHRVDGSSRLPEPAHAPHSVEQRRREPPVAEQVIVEKVQVTARKALDFRERRIDRLGVERFAAFEERFLVAEVAHVRAAA
jgi:hypothetical protein